MEKEYDIIVIGGGSAGYAAANSASQMGAKVALIEAAEILGGLCILEGCMPSKALIEVANRNLIAHTSQEFGLNIEAKAPDLAKVMERKNAVITEFQEYRAAQLRTGDFTLVRGKAKFLDASSILVDGYDEVFSAKSFIIATGSKIHVPKIPGLEEVGYLVSDDILVLEELPSSIAVLGGGAIGIEMSHYLAAMGVEVHLIQRGEHLLSHQDSDAGSALEQSFKDRGINVHVGTEIEAIQLEDGKKHITLRGTMGGMIIHVDEILCALGRKPNVDGLDLEKASVDVENSKVVIDDSMETSMSHIFAVGDVASPYDLVHLAIEQGEIAGKNAARVSLGLAESPETIDYSQKVFGVFSEPQVAFVGLSEKEAEEQEIPYHVASYPFNDHGKGIIHGEKHGFVKLISDLETNKIIGASIVGPQAVELIHQVCLAMQFGATAAELSKTPFYHPTYSEIISYPAEQLASEFKSLKTQP